MGNCMILFPNRSDKSDRAVPGATLSGPAWTLPLTNLQIRGSSKVARSQNAQAANTKFNVAMTAQREIKVVALIRHNMSVTAQWRIRAWYTGDVDGNGNQNYAYDSGFVDVYASIEYTEELNWEDESWWDGKPLGEDLQGFAQNAIHILPIFVSAPNWSIEISDESNGDGYIQIARLFMAGGWQPSLNYSYGGAMKYETDTKVETSLSGSEYYDEREPYRVVNVAFEDLPEDEALLNGLELYRRAGISQEILWIGDPENPRTIVQRSFLGRFRQLLPWEQIIFQRASIAFEIKETL